MKTMAPHKAAATASKQGPFFKKGNGLFGSTRSDAFFTGGVGRGVVQTKLSVGEPHDVYEREADAVADKVVQRYSQGEGSPAFQPVTSLGSGMIQEQCAHCAEEKKKLKDKDKGQEKIRKKPIFDSNAEPPDEDIHRKCACEEKEKVQRKSDADVPTVAPHVESSLASSRGGGAPLPDNTRQHMESAFGRDLGGVRIHTDSGAVQMNRELNAQAFTHGSDIYFNSGKYDSSGASGRHLLAHELTHVVQQGSAGGTLQRLPSLSDIGEGLSDAYDSASQTVQDVGHDLYDAGADAVNTVTDAASSALQWIETAAGKAAVALANEVVGQFGGSVTISGTTIIIDIPDVPLFEPFQKELASLPAIPLLELPIFAGGIGIFDFLATLEVNITPSLQAALGPGELRSIRLMLDPSSGSFAGHAELYVAAALGERLALFGGLVGRAVGILPTEPPIPLEASLEGGLRGTGTGWEMGALDTAVDVTYRSGSWSFSVDNDVKIGMMLQGDLDFYSAIKVYEELLCEYSYPFRHWETGKAYNVNIPLSLGGGSPPTVGPVTGSPIPIDDIKTAIEPLQHGLHCPGFPELDELIKKLCAEKKLPEAVCDPKGPLPPGKGPKGVPVVCARPLETPVAGLFAQHAFVNDPITGNNYAIREPFKSGNGVKGCIWTTTASTPPDDPATSSCKACTPPAGKTLADVSHCLLAAHMAYASPNVYQNFPDPADSFNWGPNSNTYAATLAKCCVDSSSSGLGVVPGWNHAPAAPCSTPAPGGGGGTVPGGGGGTGPGGGGKGPGPLGPSPLGPTGKTPIGGIGPDFYHYSKAPLSGDFKPGRESWTDYLTNCKAEAQAATGVPDNLSYISTLKDKDADTYIDRTKFSTRWFTSIVRGSLTFADHFSNHTAIPGNMYSTSSLDITTPTCT